MLQKMLATVRYRSKDENLETHREALVKIGVGYLDPLPRSTRRLRVG